MQSDEQAIRALITSWLAFVITKPDGESIKHSGPTLSIYRKHCDRWLLYSDANMPGGHLT